MAEEGGPEIKLTPEPPENKPESPISERKAHYLGKAVSNYDGVQQESRSSANQDLEYAQEARQMAERLTDEVNASKPLEAYREGIITKTGALVNRLRRDLEFFENEGKILAGPDTHDRGEITHLLEETARATDPEKAKTLAEAAIYKFGLVASLIIRRRDAMTEVSGAMTKKTEGTREDAEEMRRDYDKHNPKAENNTLLNEFPTKVRGLEEHLAGRKPLDREFMNFTYAHQELFEKAVKELIEPSK